MNPYTLLAINIVLLLAALAWAAVCQAQLARYKKATATLFKKSTEELSTDYTAMDLNPDGLLSFTFEKREVWVPLNKELSFHDEYENKRYTILYAYRNVFDYPPSLDPDFTFLLRCSCYDTEGNVSLESMWPDHIKRLKFYNDRIKSLTKD